MSAKHKTPGQQLKAAREELGKSQSDMAKITRISVQQLAGLEADNYDKIPAPMYVRGFIKLYAQKLGIPHEPLVEMYERIRKGEDLEPPVEDSVPQPVLDDFGPEPERFHHPEFSHENPRSRPQAVVPPHLDWRQYVEKIQTQFQQLDMEWLKKPMVRYAAIGVVGVFVISLGLRSCRGQTPEPKTAGEELPVVKDPLLSVPEPVYFQLPSSYQ